jgi:phosphate transport system substrate-binding protein
MSLSLKSIIFCLIVLCLTLEFGCESQEPAVKKKLPLVAIDETLQPVMEAELKAFRELYPKFAIQVLFTNEREAIRLFLADSAQVALIPRPLSSQEKDWFRAKIKFTPKETPFATDAVLLIVHPANPDSQLSLSQIRSILKGEVRDWKALNPKREKSGEIQVVFDNNHSSLLRYMQDSLLRGDTLASNVFAARSNPQVIEYIQNNPNAIGVIGYNWLSDKKDSTVQNYLSKTRMVGIGEEGKEAVKLDEYIMYKISQQKYPLLRKFYFWNREGKMGPATAFVSYAAGKDGQLIAFKADLLPANEVIRLVEVKESKVKVTPTRPEGGKGEK